MRVAKRTAASVEVCEARVKLAEHCSKHVFGSQSCCHAGSRTPARMGWPCRLRPLPPQPIKRYDRDCTLPSQGRLSAIHGLLLLRQLGLARPHALQAA